jgi:hypothetical protein
VKELEAEQDRANAAEAEARALRERAQRVREGVVAAIRQIAKGYDGPKSGETTEVDIAFEDEDD